MKLTKEHPGAKELEEVEIRGFDAYIDRNKQKIYIEFQDELVGMQKVRAWNELINEGKKKFFDNYEEEKSIEEKEAERKIERARKKLEEVDRKVLDTMSELDN